MKPTTTILNTIKTGGYQLPSLASISAQDLAHNGFGHGNYFLTKTKFGHWPVYKKIQNTKITTEIKRIQGDINKFKADLVQAARINPQLVTVNKTAGYVNIKGDVVENVKRVFDQYIK